LNAFTKTFGDPSSAFLYANVFWTYAIVIDSVGIQKIFFPEINIFVPDTLTPAVLVLV
jgi:hypothetical protein